MLKKALRLSKNKDFDRVFQAGHSVYGRVIGLKMAPNSLPYNRYGILVSTKVSKKAVERNQIKRRIKAIISQEEPVMLKGQDFVFITFPLILAKNYKEIKDLVTSLLKKIKAYE